MTCQTLSRPASINIISQSFGKEIPWAAAAFGTRLVDVMPGMELASSTNGCPSLSVLKSKRTAPLH